MSNAALELSGLFESWNVPQGQSIANSRRTGAQEDLGFWREQGNALVLLSEIDVRIGAMKAAGDDVDMYEQYMPVWYKAAYAPDQSWSAGQTNGFKTVSPDGLHMLRGLGLLLSKMGNPGAGSPTKRNGLRACLDDAVLLLETDLADWDSAEKGYLYQVIAAARNLLEKDAVLGERDVLSAINELIGALTSVALDLRAAEGAKSTRWERVMNVVGKTTTVLRGIIYDAEAMTSLNASVSTIVGQITATGE